MARGARSRIAGLLPHLLYLQASIGLVVCVDYGVPIEIKSWDSGRSPLAHMVDVTNGFGLKVLAEHNFLNDNNIAFSPYGLMGILVALYEGVDGESSYQIQRGMQLPWNRNLMRIGFRDIHRTLKTYFVPEEGFLAGLALNNDNVTFNESYKNILRFYGFDLGNEQIPNTEQNNTIVSTTTAESVPLNTGYDTASTTVVTTETVTGLEDPSTISTKEETTTNPDVETINDIDPRDQISTTTTSPGAVNTEFTLPSTIVTTTTEHSTRTETEVSTLSTLVTEAFNTTLPAPIAETTLPEPSQGNVATSEATKDENGNVLTTPEITSATVLDSTLDNTAEISTVTTSNINESQGTSTISETMQTVIKSMTTETTTPSDFTTVTDTSTLETLERRKKSIVDYVLTKAPIADDYLIYRSFDIPPQLIQSDLNSDKMFLVNGLKNVQVTYMQYDTVLEHAYLPHLEASALRLPLDSDRYYLLVVLPSRGGAAELGRLLARMARESDLSDVYGVMRPKRVRAIVPSFTVKGHVTLTTDLQKLGIRDVFEPRQHDFTPMTRQSGVYVRSIEQAVSVAIRKYQPDDQKKNRYVTHRNRVFFSATYPFLYFVMDSSIHVSLMAGKMVDPLNTRIL